MTASSTYIFCACRGVGKGALKEIAELYMCVIGPSFDKETEIERLRGSTLRGSAQAQVAQNRDGASATEKTALRRKLSQALQEAYLRQRRRQNSI